LTELLGSVILNSIERNNNKTKEFKTNVKIHDIIKSYDFPHNTSCYAIGIVTALEGDYINFTCIKQVWEGEAVDPSEYENKKEMRTVKQGCMCCDEGFPNRVTVIG